MRGTEGVERDPGVELRALVAEWRFPVDAARTGALLRYADLLTTWNRRINLTGARSAATVVADHFPDAFAIAERLVGPLRLVDVGSGGGLPALPLALLRPEIAIQLCEPTAKKGAFLRTAIRELDLADRVRLHAGRGEDLAAVAPGTFDAAISRATLEPAIWVALGRRLVRPGGRVFVLTVPGSGGIAGKTAAYFEGRRLLIDVSL